jgi:phosphoserine phosphatase
VSGGFDCLIHPVADKLGIPLENVFANKLKFYYDGSFAGFDGDQPTSRSGGKSAVIEILRSRHSVIVMVGDGITDLEACPPADAFIGKSRQVKD